MEVNSTSLDNSVLLYIVTPDDYHQLIKQQVNKAIPSFVLVNEEAQLEQIIAQETPQFIIIVGDAIPDSLAKILNNIHENQLTTVHIFDKQLHKNEAIRFDFILNSDETLASYLQQIIQFKHQQLTETNKLQQRIEELESQLSTEKQHSNQIEVLKEAIVRNVSHELKTPLLHVKSAVSLMAEDIGKDNKLIRYAENATARLETLVTNITMFGSSLDMNLGPVIVRDAVEYSHRNLRRIWESKEQAKRISIHLDEDLPPVLADRQGLSTILQLLLDNALKFSDDKIEVHAHLIDTEVEISVIDYGIGIDSKNIDSIFDSFYQIDPSSTRRYGGTGVGLALVKLLTEKHMSKIKVESEINKGSKFSFRLKVINFK